MAIGQVSLEIERYERGYVLDGEFVVAVGGKKEIISLKPAAPDFFYFCETVYGNHGKKTDEENLREGALRAVKVLGFIGKTSFSSSNKIERERVSDIVRYASELLSATRALRSIRGNEILAGKQRKLPKQRLRVDSRPAMSNELNQKIAHNGMYFGVVRDNGHYFTRFYFNSTLNILWYQLANFLIAGEGEPAFCENCTAPINRLERPRSDTCSNSCAASLSREKKNKKERNHGK